MEKIYSEEKPKMIMNNGSRKRLNYSVRELSKGELEALWEQSGEHLAPFDFFAKEHRYEYYSVEIGSARWNYEGVVEAIIRDKYTTDEMEAITNNMNAVTAEFFNILVSSGIINATKYLLENTNNENTKNFKAMQEWRVMAKSIAKEIFKNI